MQRLLLRKARLMNANRFRILALILLDNIDS